MFNDQKGVRISHGEIHIKDIQPNVLYSVPVSAKNISTTSKTIRFYPPQKACFRLRVIDHEKTVAPGLDHSAVIEFQSSDTSGFTDRLVVTVDGEIIEVPIIVRPCEPLLSVVREVDFGTMVMANKVVTKEILMKNNGSQPGSFQIDYRGDKPLNIVPSSGVVPPRTAQMLRVEYVVKRDHKFDERALITLEGQEPFEMRVMGSIVKRKLQLLNPESEEDMSRVSMGATYYGTDRLEAAVLYNNGPEVIQFVSVLVEDTVGQESGASRSAECKECTNPLTSLVGMVPNQGTLGPYQKVPVFFRFSPRWKVPSKTFYSTKMPPPKQDFALFLRIQMVGGGESGEPDENDSKEAQQEKNSVQIEVAITGTALPVLISVDPTSQDFGSCSGEDTVEHRFTVTNRSDRLPAHFEFQRIAHFSASPERGAVAPGDSLAVTLAFIPKQIGTFNVQQPIHVMGTVGDNDNPFEATFDVIHTEMIYCTAQCFSTVTDGRPTFNPGIVPLITNEVGINVGNVRFDSLLEKPRMAMIADGATAATQPQGSALHMTQEAMHTSDQVLKEAHIAFPNDRFASIRPSEQNKSYKTILRREERYNFVDPDYAYTAEEAEAIRAHRDQYAKKVHKYHQRKMTMARDKLLQPFENSLDLGIPPGGLVNGRLLKMSEIGTASPEAKLPNQAFKLLSTKDLGSEQQTTKTKKSQGTFNVIPTTEQEKVDCRKTLSPQQLHQIVAGPSTVDFGRVCLRSVTQRELQIVNHLPQYIHIVVDIGCRELRQSSPLSQVVAPSSKSVIPLIFESNSKGKFQRNVNYTINGHHKNHIIALAEVVPVDLTISPNQLDLHPTPGISVEDGVRGIVTLQNSLNSPAEFYWEPIFKANKTAFSICPRSGVVEEFSSLDCEVVFYPSFDAVDRGEFQLLVRGASLEGKGGAGGSGEENGERHLLECRAHIGYAYTFFMNRRVVFGHIPLNLTTVKTAVLANSSSQHSYFRVLNPNPLPGMTILPLTGAVPVGGEAQLKVSYLPSVERKVDCSVRVALRGGRELELRIAGNVIQPLVDILQTKFDFGGVYVGSKGVLYFDMVNQTATRTLVEFDLARFRDFSMKFPDHLEDEKSRKRAAAEGIYSCTIKGRDKVTCQLIFRPTEVASYDFHLLVHINQMKAPSAAETPIPPTPQEIPVYLGGPGNPAALRGPNGREGALEGVLMKPKRPALLAPGMRPEWHGPLRPPRPQKQGQQENATAKGRSIKSSTNDTPGSAGKESNAQLPLTGKKPVPNITPSRHVVATGIRQPLLLSTEEINFSAMQPGKQKTGKYPVKYLTLVNHVDGPLNWTMALSKACKDGGPQCLLKILDSEGRPVKHIKAIRSEAQRAVEGSAAAEEQEELAPSMKEYLPNIFLDDRGNVCGQLNVMGETMTVGVQCVGEQPGKYLYRIPVFIKDEVANAYTYITVRGRVPGPKLRFHPKTLILTPTPLNTEITVAFYITAEHYTKEAQLEFELPDMKAESGAIIRPLRFTFMDENIVKPQQMEEKQEFLCRVCFKAEQPIQFNGPVFVTDGLGNRFSFTVVLSADNSLLTTYPFMARHKDDYHIVCEEGRVLEGREDVTASEMGEAQMMPLGTGELPHSRASTAATSSNFDVSNNSYEGSMSASETPMPSTPRDGALVQLRSKYTGEGGNVLVNNSQTGLDLLAVDDDEDSGTEDCTPQDMLSAGTSGGSTSEELYVHQHGPRRQKTPSRSSAAGGKMYKDKSGNLLARAKALRDEDRNSSCSMIPGLERDWTQTTCMSEKGSLGGAGKQHLSYHTEDLTQSHPQVVLAVQKWFSQFGWPGGPFPSKLPESFRSRLSRKEPTEDENRKEHHSAKKNSSNEDALAEKEDALNNADWSSSGVKAEQRTLYDMLWHLSGSGIPGISLSGSLPPTSHPSARLRQVLAQHQALLQFLKVQGGAVGHITPQMLMDRGDYSVWLNAERQRKALEKVGGNPDLLIKSPGSIGEEEMSRLLEVFEAESRRAWTDLLLQVFKTLVLSRVTLKSFRNLRQPDPDMGLPQFNVSPLASNCYSLSERILLAWLNHFYERYRERIWKPCPPQKDADTTGDLNSVTHCRNAPRGSPPPRWIVNFENDLMDGLVLGTVLGAHMPFLIETHLKDMYTYPNTAEQCLHNCLKVVNAMRSVGMEFDIQALDITSPHPIPLLMLTAYLYETLPQYICSDVVEFEGILHGVATRQIKVNNPTNKPLTYRAILAGHDERDFALPKGDLIVIPPRGHLMVVMEFKSRYLRTSEGYLLLVSKNTGPNVGCTLTFSLKGHVCQVIPAALEKLSSPCYFLKHLELRVVNPFPLAGEFQVTLMESETEASTAAHLLKKFASRPSHLQRPEDFVNSVVPDKAAAGGNKAQKGPDGAAGGKVPFPKGKQVQFIGAGDDNQAKGAEAEEAVKEDKSQLLSFFSYSTSVSLQPHSHALLPLTFLPFQVGKKHCYVRMLCPDVGEFLHSIEATAELPLSTPLPLPAPPKPGETVRRSARVTSAVAAARGAKGDDNVVYWRCEVGRAHTETLSIPVANRQKENALIMAAQQYLSEQEISRRRITGTLESNTLASKALEMLTVKKHKKATKQGEEMAKKYDRRKNTLIYRVETSSQFFKAPENIALPDPSVAAFKSDAEPTVELNLTFQARQAGVYPCDLVIKGADDVRVHRIECMVVPEGSEAELHFHAPVHETVTQLIPLVNMTAVDWPMKAILQPSQNIGFSGPDRILAKAKTTSQYTLKFRALKEGDVMGKLELVNENDGTRHLYHLKGRGKKPLALDTVQFEGQVMDQLSRILTVPNTTRRKLVFEVETDLPAGFLHGPEKLTVLPGRQVGYNLCITPTKRGHFEGIVAFVAGRERVV